MSPNPNRIEQLKEEKAENLAVLEEATTSGMAAGGNREMYQEVDHIDEALNAARKQVCWVPYHTVVACFVQCLHFTVMMTLEPQLPRLPRIYIN